MKICKVWILLTAIAAHQVGATPIAHWQYDGSLTDDSLTADGAQNVSVSGNDSGNIVASADIPGAMIFDPISGSTRVNTGSVSMFGDRTNTGGTIDDNGTSRLQTSGTDLQASNESFTFETFLKVSSLSLNNGTVSFAGQFNNTGAGGFNQGWLSQLRPNDGTPDTFSWVDLSDTNNVNDAQFTSPWSVADPTDGAWHHFAVVYDHGAGTFESFLDYQSIGIDTVDTSTDSFARSSQLLFGVRFFSNPATDTTSSVGLLLDETRYANSALSSDDFLRAIPEPSSLALVLVGFAAIRLTRKRG